MDKHGNENLIGRIAIKFRHRKNWTQEVILKTNSKHNAKSNKNKVFTP